jgi:uncharacterized membrane protein YccF (DUF307 family)
MRFIGNLLWLLFGGFPLALGWLVAGLLWCITIVGIPVGVQCFKFCSLALWPFGKEIDFSGVGAISVLINIVWLLFGGIEIAAASAIVGLLFCVTVVGIPFGLQSFKLAKLALLPFGAKVRS